MYVCMYVCIYGHAVNEVTASMFVYLPDNSPRLDIHILEQAPRFISMMLMKPKVLKVVTKWRGLF